MYTSDEDCNRFGIRIASILSGVLSSGDYPVDGNRRARTVKRIAPVQRKLHTRLFRGSALEPLSKRFGKRRARCSQSGSSRRCYQRIPLKDSNLEVPKDAFSEKRKPKDPLKEHHKFRSQITLISLRISAMYQSNKHLAKVVAWKYQIGSPHPAETQRRSPDS